jgi:AcrR family transcriptional regulator
MRNPSRFILAFFPLGVSMKSKSPPLSRKRPVQERSRQTVKAILQATAQVLVQRGYESTTTGAVAERAGASIGTLYQYFPNKESLVAALVEEHVHEVLSLVEAALARYASEPLPVLLGAIVRASLDAHQLNPPLHKVLIEQVPREGKLGDALGISERVTDRIQAGLQERYPVLSPERIRLVSFMLETTVEALTHRAVIENPQWLTTGLLETEAVDLLLPYLTQSLNK